MFKELKVLKLLVFFGVFFLLFFGKNVNNQQKLLFFCSENGYVEGQEISISFLSENQGVNSGIIRITDLDGNIELEESISELIHPDNMRKSILSEGYQGAKSELNFELEPGFHTVNEFHPLVIKNSSKKSQITVVVPLMNILMYQYVKGDKAVYGKSSIISTLQNIIMDENLKDARDHFKTWEENYTVNYITDYDLEDFDAEPQPKLLVFAGNVPFWTLKMKNQFNKFLNNGGNSLLITSYFQDNFAQFDSEKHQVRIRRKAHPEGYSAWVKKPYELSSIISYAYGGVPTSVEFKSEQDFIEIPVLIQSDLDMGVRDTVTVVQLEEGKYTPIKLKWFMSRNSHRESNEVKTGVVEFQFSEGQKVVSLGSCDWLRSYNQNEQSNARQTILNIIDYLLK